MCHHGDDFPKMKNAGRFFYYVIQAGSTLVFFAHIEHALLKILENYHQPLGTMAKGGGQQPKQKTQSTQKVKGQRTAPKTLRFVLHSEWKIIVICYLIFFLDSSKRRNSFESL